MMLLAIFAVVVALILRVVTRVYSEFPVKELKRKSHRNTGDSQLLTVASYGRKAEVLLGGLAALFTALVAYSLGKEIGVWSVLPVGLLVLYLFVYPSRSTSSGASRWLAVKLAPYFAQLLKLLDPLLSLLLPHTIVAESQQKLYDKDDLINFLDQQKAVQNSRLPHDQIDKLIKILKTREKLVRTIMTDRKHMKFLQAGDSVGPILLSELYESKQTAFAVEDEDGGVAGTVGLEKLAALREGGEVKRAVDFELAFVNQNWLASSVLTAYINTKKDTFLVVDELGKVVGLVSLDQVIEATLDKTLHASRPDYASAESVSVSSN